jgi:hypothetical protein
MGKLAAQGRFLFAVVAPRSEHTDPRNAFGSAQMICDALNLAMANPDFVQAYSHYLCIVLDETNGPMGAVRAQFGKHYAGRRTCLTTI